MIDSRHGEEQTAHPCPDSAGHSTVDSQPDGKGDLRQPSTHEEPNPRLDSAGHSTLDSQPDGKGDPRQPSTHEEPNPRLDSAGHSTVDSQPDGKGDPRQPSTHEESNPRHIPPDGGWGWVVLGGSIFICVFMVATLVCFGVLFSSKMGQLGASSTTISWIFNLSGILYSAGVGITNTLSKCFGHRPVAFVCCLVASLSFMLLAFTNSLVSITVLYGVIIPMSSGIGSSVPFLIVPLYFEKRRGRAMAALITGVPFGVIVLPFLLRGLQDHYGFAGAVLLLGALMAHCCVAAALFRPVTRTHSNKTVCPERFSIDEQKENRRRATSFSLSQTNSKSSKDSVHLQVLNNEISDNRSRQDENDSIENNIQDDSENQFSRTNIKKHRKHKRIRKCDPLHNQLRKLLRKTLATLNHRQLVLLGLCHALSLISYSNLMMFVPFALEFSGHSSQFSAQALSVAGLANTVTRVVVVLVADCKWLNRRVALILGLLVVTLFTFVFSQVTTSLPWVLVSMVGVGVGIGLAFSLVYTVMIDMMGLKLYATCVGFSAIVEIVLFSTIGPAIGALRDWSGSYGWSVWACAVLQLCSALMLLPLSCAQTHDGNIRLKTQHKKESN